MKLSKFFKSVLEQDAAPVVICDLEHTVVYMNPASVAHYHTNITGKSVKSCHNAESNAKIDRVVAWFSESKDNNIVFTYRNDKENNRKNFSYVSDPLRVRLVGGIFGQIIAVQDIPLRALDLRDLLLGLV